MRRDRDVCRADNIKQEASALKSAMAIKEAGNDFIALVENLSDPGRELSLFKTKVEEAVMWAVKGVTQ